MTAILIGGQKGGTGKSTIATNIAIMATLMGHDVAMLDTETKQSSSTNLISRRHEKGIKPTPPCFNKYGKELYAEIEDLNSHYEIVIIDSGGRDSPELRACMGCKSVQYMYSPLAPSEFDLETLQHIDDLVYSAQFLNHNLNASFILNRAPTHPKITITADAKNHIITEAKNIKLANTILGERIPVKYATGEFLSVVEYETNLLKNLPPYKAKSYSMKASLEFCNLYKEIFNEDFKNDYISENINTEECHESI